MLPEHLNQTSDDELFAHVDSAADLGDAAATENPPPLAPFVTLEMLRRIHERVVHLKRTGHAYASKHVLLARAVLRITGVPIAPDVRDVDKIGNHLDIWLSRRYIQLDRKLTRNVRDKTAQGLRRAELKLQCCQVTAWGGVTECYPATGTSIMQGVQHAPHVPFTRTCLPPEWSTMELKRLVNEARSEADSAFADLQRERERSSNAKRRYECAQSEASAAVKLLEMKENERRDVATQAEKKIKTMNSQWRAERLRLQKESALTLREAEAKVLRLGSQVAAAAQEAAAHAHDAEDLRARLELEQERAEAEANELRQEAAKLRTERKRADEESARALRDADAKVLRLGSQVAAAAQEAAVHARNSEELRARLELEQERAEATADELRHEAAKLRIERKRTEKESARALLDAEARTLRLGSQVAAAAQEAAMHAKEEERLRSELEMEHFELEDALKSQEFFRMKAEMEAETRRQRYKECLAANASRDAVKATSQKRLQAKQALEEIVAELKDDLEAARDELEVLRAEREANRDAVKKLALMPTWQRTRAGQRGGGLRLEHTHRLAILEQHANGTPPSCIGRNIVSIVKKAAPWLKPVQPTVREIRQMGFELATLEEALAARKCAAAYKVNENGPAEDLVLKAAYLSTRGGTADAIASEIEDNCFARLRDLLRLWKEYHQRMFPGHSWTGPDPRQCSLHRLAGGGGLMSDTCPAARKVRRLLSDLIGRQAEVAFREEHGDDAWESLADDEREVRLRVHALDCHQHLRNIWLGHMSRKQAQHVRNELSEQLKQFMSWERMTTDYDNFLRAVYKEFHEGGRYYKGKGADFASWLLEHHPAVFFMHIERADGGRQDLDYDAAIPIYINRRYLVEYLDTLVFASTHSNILEDFLYQALLTDQFIAMSRANGLIDLRISRPHRWLSGKSHELNDWSPIKMNGVLDLIDDLFQKMRDDGSVLLDPALDIFKTVADTQPLFQAYREFTYEYDIVLSPNGRVRHLHYKCALHELLNPEDETNRRTRAKTVEYLQVQAAAALEKMHDRKLAIADKLSSQSGANSVAQQTAAHTDLVGCNATNDQTAESVYGAWKLERRRNPGISVRRSSGLAQARISKSLAHDDAVQHRKSRIPDAANRVRKKRRVSVMFGFFHSLAETEQVALVEMCRAERPAQRALDRMDEARLDSHRRALRKTNSQLELESLVKNFAMALSFFDRYKQRGITSMDEAALALAGLTSDQLRLDWLREQIEMRVVGLGWVEYRIQWSSGKDKEVGTITALKSHLADIMVDEAERTIPEAAPAPIMSRKTFKQLGTPTAQAERLSTQYLSLSSEHLLAAAQRKRAELEANGELDIVGDRQPRNPPLLNQDLVGRKLEIHWRYWRPALPGERGKKKQVFIWCEGTVDEVSDGTIRKSKRSPEAHPAGAVRIRWPADAEYEEKETLVWSILNPSDWCKEVHLGWRWAKCELEQLSP